MSGIRRQSASYPYRSSANDYLAVSFTESNHEVYVPFQSNVIYLLQAKRYANEEPGNKIYENYPLNNIASQKAYDLKLYSASGEVIGLYGIFSTL